MRYESTAKFNGGFCPVSKEDEYQRSAVETVDLAHKAATTFDAALDPQVRATCPPG